MLLFPVLVMMTGANQVNGGVPGGSQGGWLSGNPASLGSNGVVTSVFDLGPQWNQYGLLQATLKGSQAISAVLHCGDNGTTIVAPLMGVNALGAALSLAGAGFAQALVLPSGRYVHAVVTSGAIAQDATCSVRLTTYPV